jgi:L-aspartate oxidase
MREAADLLVLGAGIAGCSAALRAADQGIQVVLVAKDELGGSNTAWAQGGIIGKPPPEEGDSPTLLAEDIEAAGAGLCRPEAVRQLAE